MTKSDSQKKEFILVPGFRGRAHNGRRAMVEVIWSRKLIDHVSTVRWKQKEQAGSG